MQITKIDRMRCNLTQLNLSTQDSSRKNRYFRHTVENKTEFSVTLKMTTKCSALLQNKKFIHIKQLSYAHELNLKLFGEVTQ